MNAGKLAATKHSHHGLAIAIWADSDDDDGSTDNPTESTLSSASSSTGGSDAGTTRDGSRHTGTAATTTCLPTGESYATRTGRTWTTVRDAEWADGCAPRADAKTKSDGHDACWIRRDGWKLSAREESGCFPATRTDARTGPDATTSDATTRRAAKTDGSKRRHDE